MKDRPRPRATAMTSRASTTHSGSIEIPRHSITPKISAKYRTLPMRMRRGRRGSTRSALAGADNRDRCNLDRHGQGQGVRTHRGSRVLAGLAKHVDQQIRGAVDDFRLVAEVIGRKHESDQLHHLLYIVESGSRLHLSKQVERAQARRRLRLLDRYLVWAPSGQALASLNRDLTRDEEQ